MEKGHFLQGSPERNDAGLTTKLSARFEGHRQSLQSGRVINNESGFAASSQHTTYFADKTRDKSPIIERHE